MLVEAGQRYGERIGEGGIDEDAVEQSRERIGYLQARVRARLIRLCLLCVREPRRSR